MGRTFKKNADYGYKPDYRNSKKMRKLNKQLQKINEKANEKQNDADRSRIDAPTPLADHVSRFRGLVR